MTEALREVINWNDSKVAAISLNSDTNVIKRGFEEPDDFITASIRFSDNYWDFSKDNPKAKRIVDDRHPRFDFTQINSKAFRVTLKLVVIRLCFLRNKKLKFKSIKQYFLDTVMFLKYLETERYINRVDFITPAIIEDFMDKYESKSERFKNGLLTGVRRFIEEIEFGGAWDNPQSIQYIFETIRSKKVGRKDVRNSTLKHPNIPKKLYENIINCALEDIKNENLSIENRLAAGCIVMLGETGMRMGECRIIEAGKLKEISIFEGKAKAYYLEFLTYKTTEEQDGRWTISKASENMIIAYKLLENLTKAKRKKLKNNYLVTNNEGNVLSNTSFYHRFYNFFHRNREKLSIETLDEFEKKQLKEKNFNRDEFREYREERKEEWIGTTFYAVTPHQFRVHMANVLREKGLSVEWIKQHMNHIEDEMTKWYFRDPEDIKKAVYYHSSIDGTSLVPNKSEKIQVSEEELESACDTINKFLKKKKLNLFKDIDEIIDIWENNPLNESLVGLCRKAAGMLCDRQNKLATLEKWYYLSPQVADISAFDFTFKRFLDKAKIVEHNKNLFKSNEQYKRAYEVELVALQKFYKNRLIPEYDLVLSTLEENGIEYIINTYANLREILSQLDSIEKEIKEWEIKLQLRTSFSSVQKSTELAN